MKAFFGSIFLIVAGLYAASAVTTPTQTVMQQIVVHIELCEAALVALMGIVLIAAQESGAAASS